MAHRPAPEPGRRDLRHPEQEDAGRVPPRGLAADGEVPAQGHHLRTAHERIIKLHIGPRLGSRTLQSLTPMMVNTFYQELMRGDGLKKPLSDKTVRNVHVVLRKALADAVNDGLIQRNVAALARPPRPSVSATRFVMRVWNADEVGRFLAHLADDRLLRIVACRCDDRDAPRRAARPAVAGRRPSGHEPRCAPDARVRRLQGDRHHPQVEAPADHRPRRGNGHGARGTPRAAEPRTQACGPDRVDSGYVFGERTGRRSTPTACRTSSTSR